MDWKDIKTLLLKHHTKFLSYSFSRKTIAQTLSDTLGVPVAESAVAVKGTSVFVSVHPAIKNELLLKKQEILLLLRKQSINVSDIK